MPEIPLGNVVGPQGPKGDKGDKGDTGTFAPADLQRIADLESNKVDKVTGKGLSVNDYTDADKTAVGTIGNKVDKVTGKGLSTNDYTDADKTAVGTIGNKVDKVTGKGLSANDYTDADKTAVGTIGNKVDKVTGKGLSANDYTDADKTKLSGIEAQANKTIIDSTLSNAGQAADAKTTGDHIAALQNLLSRMEIHCEASGNPVTFSDAAAANVKALSVTLTPTQTGSGNPSPSNVRPVSGVSSVRITRHNAPSATLTITPTQTGSGNPSPSNVRPLTPGLSFKRDDNSTLNVYGGTLDTKTGVLVIDRVSVTLTGSYVDSISSASTADSLGGKRIVTTVNNATAFPAGTVPGNLLSDRLNTVGGGNIYGEYCTPNTVAVNDAGAVCLRYMGAATVSDAQTALNANPAQVVYPLATPVTYQLTPTETERALAASGYAAKVVTVTLVDSNSDPLTVYGGTLDVTSGTLTVTHAKISVSALPLNSGSSGGGLNWSDIERSVFDNTALSNMLPPLASGDSAWYSNKPCISTAGETNGNKVRAYLTPAQKTGDYANAEIVYRLASPVTYQLTPQQLATLAGYNAVSSDAGTLDVTYKADASLVFGGGT